MKPPTQSTLALFFFGTLSVTALAAPSVLPPFSAELGHQNHPVPGMPPFRAPYHETARHFGYYDSTLVDLSPGGSNFQILYFWINQNTPEIGVRFLSPATSYDTVGRFVTKDSNYFGETNYFNPMIRLEKASVGEPRYLTDDKVRTARWAELGQNDDDSELPPQPQGDRSQACVRAVLNEGKGLTRGLYRILIRASASPAPSFQVGLTAPAATSTNSSNQAPISNPTTLGVVPVNPPAKGYFMAEVGTLGKVSAIAMGRTVAEIARKAFEIDATKK